MTDDPEDELDAWQRWRRDQAREREERPRRDRLRTAAETRFASPGYADEWLGRRMPGLGGSTPLEAAARGGETELAAHRLLRQAPVHTPI